MFLREAVRVRASEVVLCTSKMFFAYGLDNAVLGPLSIGATSIQFAGWPGVDEILDAADRHAPVCLLTMPTLYRRLLQLEPSRLSALRSIRFFSTGGERVPDGLLAQWERVTGVPLLVSYGMSETFCNATANFADRRRGAGSIGLPLAGVSCRLLDGDNQPVPAGEPGVLWIRHPALALRYSDPVLTSHAFRDGWLCTGDLCMIDADGFVYHQGRADELLRVAGQWVKPADVVEAVLADSRLREAVCVVLPDGDGFERLALFVAGHPGVGPADQIAARRVGTLPRHSQPKWIREVADFPRTATGKVQRFALREALLEELRTARVAAAPNDRK